MTDKIQQARRVVSPEYVKECFTYDGKTGDLFWSERPESHFSSKKIMRIANRLRAGKKVTNKNAGYLRVRLHGRAYSAHRIIWAICNGRWPSDQIDHIDGNTENNKIENLREVDIFENGKNQSRRAGAKTKLLGVCWHKGILRWVSYIRVRGKLHSLGAFVDFFDAVCARKSAEIAFGFHINHGRNSSFWARGK